MADTTVVCAMQWSWRIPLLGLGGIGAVAAVLCGVELAGLVPRGTVVTDGSDVERWVAVAVGILVQPFAITTWKNAKVQLTSDHLICPRLGFVTRTEAIPLQDVRRWGSGYEQNRGYRHLTLLLERADRSRRSLKLAMFTRQRELLAALEARLGEPAATETTFVGVTFSE